MYIPVLEKNKEISIDGYDPYTNTTIEKVNLFVDYKERKKGINATVKHGDKVTFLKRTENGVKVKTQEGICGWVTFYFIAELKEDFVKQVKEELK